MIEYLALSLFCFFVLLQTVYLLSSCKNGYHAVTMLLLGLAMKYILLCSPLSFRE